MEPSPNKVPRHIGIIIDGNRRFAKKLMLKPWKGHEWGAKKLEKLLYWCKDFGVKELTIYALSIQNLDRPKEELDYLLKLFIEFYNKLKEDKRIKESGIRIRFIGNRKLLPQNVQDAMYNLEENTKKNNQHQINFAMAYGGREEIIDATIKIAQKVKDGKLKPEEINAKTFEDNLSLKESPDMIIRTGGEKRTSNFLPYQSTYTEWFYLEKCWPEFEKEDLEKCVAEYSERERRYGK